MQVDALKTYEESKIYECKYVDCEFKWGMKYFDGYTRSPEESSGQVCPKCNRYQDNQEEDA